MVKRFNVQWTSANSDKFTFEFELKKKYGAPTVQSVHAIIFTEVEISNEDTGTSATTCSSSATVNSGDEDASSKKRKIEDEVGYLQGYIIKRNNTCFHDHRDVPKELREFALALYDSNGDKCLVPDSELNDIKFSNGSGMLFIFKVEIINSFKGNDLGINFVHELLASPTIKEDVGVVVMNPSPITQYRLHYEQNRHEMEENLTGKSKSERDDIARQNAVKLRRQFSRMGFSVVKGSPEFVNKWFLSMEDYFSNEDPRSTWLSNDDAEKLEIPMWAKRDTEEESNEDKEMKSLLQSLFEQQMFSQEPTIIALNAIIGRSTYLTKDVKAEMKSLVDAGANLERINALHLAAGHYKSDDLFDHLINDYGMSVNQVGKGGNLPIHAAAAFINVNAVRTLLARGSEKNIKNKDGLTAKQLVEKVERSPMISIRPSLGPDIQQIKKLLR